MSPLRGEPERLLLERSVGARLFARSKRRVALTAAERAQGPPTVRDELELAAAELAGEAAGPPNCAWPAAR